MLVFEKVPRFFLALKSSVPHLLELPMRRGRHSPHISYSSDIAAAKRVRREYFLLYWWKTMLYLGSRVRREYFLSNSVGKLLETTYLGDRARFFFRTLQTVEKTYLGDRARLFFLSNFTNSGNKTYLGDRARFFFRTLQTVEITYLGGDRARFFFRTLQTPHPLAERGEHNKQSLQNTFQNTVRVVDQTTT